MREKGTLVKQTLTASGLNYALEGAEHSQTIVFLHGWGSDHRVFNKQLEYFGRNYRVIAPDLPGYGASAPSQSYSVEAIATRLTSELNALQLRQAVLVGHSMGGTVALEMYRQAPSIAQALIMIDSSLWPAAPLREAIEGVDRALRENRFEEARIAAEAAVFVPSDPVDARSYFRDTYERADRKTLVETFGAHLLQYVPPETLDARQRPVAYIGAEHALSDLGVLAKHIVGIRCGQTLGSGHFCSLVIPEQVNSMVEAFLRTAATSWTD